jgi:hypothetical protein
MSPEMTPATVLDGDIDETAQAQPEVDDSLIPILADNAIEGEERVGEVAEEEAEEETGEAGEDIASEFTQPLPGKKKRSRNKGLMSRGPTALPKNRGNGFEGMVSRSPRLTKLSQY